MRKSTTLKTIAGIIKQSEGSVILGGNIADKIPAYKRRTVIVFQDCRLFPHMTVAENISFPLKMLGINKSKCREKAIELLEKVKLGAMKTGMLMKYPEDGCKELPGPRTCRRADSIAPG